MLKFLKSLLGPAPDKKITLTFEEVPSWLDEQEKAARETLHDEVEEPMGDIRNATANLQLMVNNLKDADQDPDTHPKIKSIAKNSLPLFIRAMNASLAKELPGEPEAFYTVAVECVKGCLNAIRGQGRYLMVAFPEEMKVTKTGIDEIGREINVMTKAIGRFKEKSARTGAARTAYTALSDARRDLERSVGKRGTDQSAYRGDHRAPGHHLRGDCPPLGRSVLTTARCRAWPVCRPDPAAGRSPAALCVSFHDSFPCLQESRKDRHPQTPVKRTAYPQRCHGYPVRS